MSHPCHKVISALGIFVPNCHHEVPPLHLVHIHLEKHSSGNVIAFTVDNGA